MPSAATAMESSTAPAAVTALAGTPLYRVPSKATWHRASMWLSALPWMFMAIRSAANSRPSVPAAGAWTFRCWAGSGLSALTWCSIGAASDTVRPSPTSPAAAWTWAGPRWLSAPRRSSGPQGTWRRSRSYSERNWASVIRPGGALARLLVIRSPSLAARARVIIRHGWAILGLGRPARITYRAGNPLAHGPLVAVSYPWDDEFTRINAARTTPDPGRS